MQSGIDFKKGDGLVPAIIQDQQSGQVLMLGYMNEEAYNITLAREKVTFWSRSKSRLWVKGEESGNFLDLISITKDCDSDALLVKVNPHGPTCHTGTCSCFGEAEFGIAYLEKTINQRWESKEDAPSYVRSLQEKGIKKIAQKVGEEGVEVALEAMTDNREELIGELGDLWFHSLVLMKAKGVKMEEVLALLEQRHSK
ncbi:MAG: phosphoribosyl-ATP pyrophosphohydrolase/phosphoribosyl-AMP cyclohydrolase [Sphingobacteriales bacterium]|jgi:phosphoribosyl-ATP pyrophosphohydrolase/phosphoribosyl-AMP cyclohydrolase